MIRGCAYDPIKAVLPPSMNLTHQLPRTWSKIYYFLPSLGEEGSAAPLDSVRIFHKSLANQQCPAPRFDIETTPHYMVGVGITSHKSQSLFPAMVNHFLHLYHQDDDPSSLSP
jgi:hypothetical protein